MPLSPSTVPREHIHTRTIECRGYRRADGLWDIEARLQDIKTYPFRNAWRGEVAVGEPVHDMWMRVTVDGDMLIHRVEAVTDSSPFRTCPEITPAFAKLEGLRIAAGFTAKVRELLGGVAGCTHLVELTGPIATTAFQTIFPLKPKALATGPTAPKRPPALINSCHAWSAAGEAIREFWPDYYTGSKPGESDPQPA